MKIWLFEPYMWDYCGGAVVVIAETFEDAVALIRKGNEEIGDYEKDALFFDSIQNAVPHGKKSNWEHPWLLTGSWELADTQIKGRLVTINYNYA